MSILRKDPASSGWVIIAPERALRPKDIEVCEEEEIRENGCPFCEGHESETPPEIVAYRDPASQANQPGWRVRTIPNKYAALNSEGELKRRKEAIYEMMNGIGAHEVIIETTDHNTEMTGYDHKKMKEVLQMYRERARDLIRDPRFKYIQIFRNYKASAGASLSHPHTQIIALPITPRWVKEELSCAQEHYKLKERCLFCDIINQEMDTGKRLVFENQAFISFEPYASKFPFETWIIPRKHNAKFDDANDETLDQLAEALPRTLFAISKALKDPPYNFIIHSAPHLSPGRPGMETLALDYHWHIEIIPRITKLAGFEWGTGFYINPVLPEDAAEYLRKVLK